MSEMAFIFRNHPLLITLLGLCLSPVAVSLLVVFSPILVTLMLFLLAVAGLARSRRRLGRHRSRRRRKNAQQQQQQQESPLLTGDEDELLRGEKQIRVNEYLEDQLRHLQQALDHSPLDDAFLRFDDPPFESPAAIQLIGDCEVRSDVSDVGDRSLHRLVCADEEDDEDEELHYRDDEE